MQPHHALKLEQQPRQRRAEYERDGDADEERGDDTATIGRREP